MHVSHSLGLKTINNNCYMSGSHFHGFNRAVYWIIQNRIVPQVVWLVFRLILPIWKVTGLAQDYNFIGFLS